MSDPAAPVPMDAEGQWLLAHLTDWLPAGAPPALLVTVWARLGSTPRGPGARMLVRGGKLMAGTIGGGHLEEEAIGLSAGDDAAALAGVRMHKYTLGTQLGQCCGGVVWLHVAPVTAESALAHVAALEQALASGEVLRTPAGIPVDDPRMRELVEAPAALTTVLIFGAGHVGSALSRVLEPLPWRVVVVDHRPEWANPQRFPAGVEVVHSQPLRLLAAWGWLGEAARHTKMAARAVVDGQTIPKAPPPHATRALVMTHDHALDRDLTEALLRLPETLGNPDQRLAFVGLIGSHTKVVTTHQRLRGRGVSEAALATLRAPIGLRIGNTLLGGKLPGEIAISVAAQLLADRQGLT